jgi:hypothetical protein
MNKQFITILTGLFLWGLLLTGCSPASPNDDIPDTPDDQGTSVALTVAAELTRMSLSPTSTPVSATATPTAVPPTPVPTDTPLPTETPISIPTPTPIPCNRALFVDDIRVQDGAIFTPGETFVKTWRLQNTGVCAWTTNYALVFVEGDQLEASAVVPFPAFVFPGETIDLSVNMIAPEKIGEYRGYWQLRNAEGLLFGFGDGGQNRIWVEIAVKEPLRQRVYNFATNVCEAEWQSGAGDLACPGEGKDPDGFVIYLEEARLENRSENEPTLWVHPEFTDDGWISGTYPAFTVQQGDRFQAWVGCLEGSEDCQIEFRLGYVGGDGEVIRYLKEWRENYDEAVTVINLDLSELAGDRIQFVLYTRVRQNPGAADGFWFVPVIRRIEYFK